MNWIIRRSNKLLSHTHLKGLIQPIFKDIEKWSWFISDLDFLSNGTILPINFDHDYFILSPEQFQQLVTADPQIIWGVLLGFSNEQLIDVDEENLPYAEGNELIWKNGNIQHTNALIEIVCFDSGYTIVKFRDAQLSGKFKAYFEEAIELESF
ncbi:hypothetical protein [Mucilaginibacter auburnensis]|uniref:Uncharacterized protein n=1 Tax=Mucilaginibacter auburnensis TaxID=1457233 RepID=A0A2H9VN76_9SPHI|nr:hypothetical protein [Mucilaginibacter auburnensis]PJJ79772.1 hypothetical protein CLV57_2910 [Mucilaginibacter auburnensis]